MRLQGDLGGPDTPAAAHARARLQVILARELTDAVDAFNKATARLSGALIWLTVALVLLTLILVWIGYRQLRLLSP